MIWQALRDKVRQNGWTGIAVDAGKTALGYGYIAALATGIGAGAATVFVAALPLAARELLVGRSSPGTSCRNAEEPIEEGGAFACSGCRNSEESGS